MYTYTHIYVYSNEHICYIQDENKKLNET